jgi:hypothetical protein
MVECSEDVLLAIRDDLRPPYKDGMSLQRSFRTADFDVDRFYRQQERVALRPRYQVVSGTATHQFRMESGTRHVADGVASSPAAHR